MGDIQNVVARTVLAGWSFDNNPVESEPEKPQEEPKVEHKEKNYTDPKVCHDPSIKFEGIARLWSNQNKVEMEEGELSEHNPIDHLRVDAILYPLLVINNRNIERGDILEMKLNYDSFLPTIMVRIFDQYENEKKFNSTQMSGVIRLCMTSAIDKVYKKILMNFKITDVYVDPDNTTIITYYGEYNIPLFRQTNIGHIWMEDVCEASDECMQGGHMNANTWEMLHRIAEMTGLGFAATKQCKNISDRMLRNVYMQRFDKFIEKQLKHSGLMSFNDNDELVEANIFDAWVDLYGYIVMVNVSWIINQEILPDDLTIVANTGLHGTSNDMPEQIPQEVARVLTNFNMVGAITNLEIESYSINISNDAVEHGTLEHMYTINFVGTKTKMVELDIQTKQNSVDGEYLEDYNTGKNNPIPRFNFNDDAQTELEGGYDSTQQEKIRDAYFRKIRQSILEVKLRYLNFGLQRGTLVDVEIFEESTILKHQMIKNIANLDGGETSQELQEYSLKGLPEGMEEKNMTINDGTEYPNWKLKGLYYIDSMTFEYSYEEGRIIQTLFLIKKGRTTGYHNAHTMPKLPIDKYELKPTLPQSPPYLETYNGKIG